MNEYKYGALGVFLYAYIQTKGFFFFLKKKIILLLDGEVSNINLKLIEWMIMKASNYYFFF